MASRRPWADRAQPRGSAREGHTAVHPQVVAAVGGTPAQFGPARCLRLVASHIARWPLGRQPGRVDRAARRCRPASYKRSQAAAAQQGPEGGDRPLRCGRGHRGAGTALCGADARAGDGRAQRPPPVPAPVRVVTICRALSCKRPPRPVGAALEPPDGSGRNARPPAARHAQPACHGVAAPPAPAAPACMAVSGEGGAAAPTHRQYCHHRTLPSMKLATYKDGSRDGQLVVVSRDLSTAPTSPPASPPAAAGAGRLELPLAAAGGPVRHAQPRQGAPRLRLRPARCAWRRCRAPTSGPTARPTSTTWSWCARRAAPRCRPSFYDDPLMYQGGSDDFLGPCDDAVVRQRRLGHRLRGRGRGGHRRRGRWAPRPTQALDGVRLLMLVNDWSLRNLIPAELAKGFGFLQSKPATAFSPVAVTPDELGDAWQGGRVHLTLDSRLERPRVGLCDAGAGDDLPLRPADRPRGARRASVRAGSIVGSGHGQQQGLAARLQLHRREARASRPSSSGAPKTDFMSSATPSASRC